MHRQAFDALAKFCVDQYRAFDPRAWVGQGVFDGRLVAGAAKYLSMTSWYGHAEELERISASVIDCVESNTQELIAISAGLQRELQDIGFDLVHFSAKVRYGIAECRLDHPAISPSPDDDYADDDYADSEMGDVDEPLAA